MNRLMAGASLLALITASGAAHAADAAAAADSGEVSEVIVTGTRQTGIKAADSAAPIQVVGGQALQLTGANDLALSLTSAVPSLNILTQGGDAAAVQILAALRGLSPNDTFVLVNGKRRHPTSNLAVDGGSVFSGSSTTDLAFIPNEAIDHVEVLTDGAAAQYGSDAIAGVINIILKKNSSGGVLDATGGEYYNGQGATGDVQINHGFNLNDRGFLNATFESRYHAFSVTGIGDSRFTDQNGNLLPGLPFPQSNAGNATNFPHLNQLNGDPQFNLYTGFLNGAYNITDDIEVYAFGNYSYETAQHYENYRSPAKVSGLTSTGTLVYPFPNGFDPKEKFTEIDYSFTGGIRGTIEGWHWDLSTTYGSNNTQVYVINSANAQLFPVLQAVSPTPIVPQTNFYNGAFNATEWTSNLDIDNSFNIGLAAPLNVAFGGQYQRDTYSVSPGEPSSYFGAGAQSFDGYTPLDQGYFSRTNGSFYIDVATDPIKNLHIDIAGRFEHYSDFGDAEVGKFTARYDFNSMFAIRGTVSNGFRAPTLAEERYSGTNVSPFSAEVQLPPNSAAAQSAGFQPLRPEQSQNYSVGFVVHPMENAQITLDAYQINLHDRILVSGFLYGTCCTAGSASVISQGVLNAITERGVTLDSGLSYTGISLFSNAANTRTQGVELTGAYASDFNEYGHVDWTVGFNYNKTQITKLDALPAAAANTPAECAVLPACNTAFLTRYAASALTTANPRYKVILQALWTLDKWSVNLRETIYGQTSQYSPDNSYLQYIGVTGITDLDIGYRFTKWLKLDVGANNLFNQRPPGVATVDGAPIGGGLVFKEPYVFAPYNVNGGYYYGRLLVNF